MKKLQNLQGVKILSKQEQKSVKGGLACAYPDNYCPGDTICCDGFCGTPGSWQCS